MRWLVKACDILDEPADVLVCSANVYLNLSGGVGGEILRRYGTQMQEELHKLLAQRHVHFVQRGEVIQVPSCGTAFKSVLHAVAIDGFYQSSPQVIQAVVNRALEMSASHQARRVALTALATGYGRLPMKDFASGVAPLLKSEFHPIEEVVICVRKEEQRAELARVLFKK